MAAPVYSVQIAAGAGVGSGSVVEINPPAGYIFVVRDIDAYHNGDSGLQIYCTIDGSNFAGIDFPGDDLDGWWNWRGRQVCVDVMGIIVASGGGDVCDYLVSGYQLSLP